MNENDFANDALNKLRMQTKEATDKIGCDMADQLMNVLINEPKFKNQILPAISSCPVFLYADIFDAMAKRLTERFQSEGMWHEIEGSDSESK